MRPRVALQILVGAELRRVHEYRDHNHVGTLARGCHQRQVPVVQRAPIVGTNPDGLALGPQRGDAPSASRPLTLDELASRQGTPRSADPRTLRRSALRPRPRSRLVGASDRRPGTWCRDVAGIRRDGACASMSSARMRRSAWRDVARSRRARGYRGRPAPGRRSPRPPRIADRRDLQERRDTIRQLRRARIRADRERAGLLQPPPRRPSALAAAAGSCSCVL